jgi:N6-L-threonylcarbamoyladenine synthase
VTILAVETSCDETAAAVVTDDGRVLSSIVSSQAELHARYGGVVPEVASRHHLELLVPVVREALTAAGLGLGDVTRVAVTQGPGLVGALLVGLQAAKALEPDPLEPPFVCLLASGGHTLLLDVPAYGEARRIGTTLDDAAGEAFDKGARLLGLGYPGGAALERLARDGDAEAYPFPVARVGGLDFSFSGLKTSLLYAVRELGDALEPRRADLAASYQAAIVRALVERLARAVELTGVDRVALVGGVAANGTLRTALPGARFAPLHLCTDNAAMIGSAARFGTPLRAPGYLGLDAYSSS